MARASVSAWDKALKARWQSHARFEKAKREGRMEEEGRLYDEETRKKWEGTFEFAPMPPPYPGTLRLVPPTRKFKGKKNPE